MKIGRDFWGTILERTMDGRRNCQQESARRTRRAVREQAKKKWEREQRNTLRKEKESRERERESVGGEKARREHVERENETEGEREFVRAKSHQLTFVPSHHFFHNFMCLFILFFNHNSSFRALERNIIIQHLSQKL